MQKKDRELALFFTFLLGMSLGSPVTWLITSVLGVDVDAKEVEAWMSYVTVAVSFVIGLAAVVIANRYLGGDGASD